MVKNVLEEGNIPHTPGVSRALIISKRQTSPTPMLTPTCPLLIICHHCVFVVRMLIAGNYHEISSFSSAPACALFSDCLKYSGGAVRRKSSTSHSLTVKRGRGRRWERASARCVQCPPRRQNLEHETRSICRGKICLAGACCSFMVRHRFESDPLFIKYGASPSCDLVLKFFTSRVIWWKTRKKGD